MRSKLDKTLLINKSKGMTFVEITISITVALIVFLMIYRFMTSTRTHYMYGTVNLQNLQEARMAINYLRRDFACVSPLLKKGSVNFQTTQRIQKQIFDSAACPAGIPTDGLIQVLPQGLVLFCSDFKSTSVHPALNRVIYEFDPPSKTLSRHSNGKIVKFSGFDSVFFKTYVHQINPETPMLFVKFKIHEGEKIYGSNDIGSSLELTTTIGSQFIDSNLANRSWRFETEHTLN